jgi:hypothetical protein
VLAAAEQRTLSQGGSRQDLATAANEQVAVWWRIEPCFGFGRAVALELGCLARRERCDGLPHDARVCSIQAQLPEHEQHHLTEHIRSRVTTAAKTRNHLQCHRRDEPLHVEAAESPLEITDHVFLQGGSELVREEIDVESSAYVMPVRTYRWRAGNDDG